MLRIGHFQYWKWKLNYDQLKLLSDEKSEIGFFFFNIFPFILSTSLIKQSSESLFSPSMSRLLQCCIISPNRETSPHLNFCCSPDWIHPQNIHLPEYWLLKAAEGAQRDWVEAWNPTVAQKPPDREHYHCFC